MAVRLHIRPLPGRVARDDRETPVPRSYRVLLVGPRRDAVVLRSLLRRAGAPVTSCVEVARVSEAWPAVGNGEVDAALVVLPGSGPDELLAFTRLQASTPEVPFVVVVDASREADGLEALRFGAQEYVIRQSVDAPSLARCLRCAVERHHHLALLRDLSFTDPLTGLNNRRGFRSLAQSQLELLRKARRPAVLLYADVDGLKVINDIYGHAEGDRALVRVARALRGTLRHTDLLARFGGDEFVALQIDADAASIPSTLRRIRDALERDNGGEPLRRPSVSIGTSVFAPAATTDLRTLIARADRDLYRSRGGTAGGRRAAAGRGERLARASTR